ncbi:hypothetical protein ACA910_007878 [Epithemia clementina (nom. ined.)]
MGSLCFKQAKAPKAPEQSGGTLGVMFARFDKESKGYISRQDLQSMMKDDKTHFQGRDAEHIMNKYGTDGKMDFDQFSTWWNSTYTTYNNDDIANLVEQVNEEERMETIEETELPQDPHITNKAVGRS